MKIEIKKSNILPFLAVGTLFYSLFPIYIWGTAMAANSRTIAVCLGTAYILTNINIIKCKKYVWHLMYIAVIVLSSYFNYPHTSVNNILNIKPISSTIIGKIKSVCASGKYKYF